MDYRNSIQTIVIGDQITQIGWNAFPLDGLQHDQIREKRAEYRREGL